MRSYHPDQYKQLSGGYSHKHSPEEKSHAETSHGYHGHRSIRV
jgi:hypothetical protein